MKLILLQAGRRVVWTFVLIAMLFLFPNVLPAQDCFISQDITISGQSTINLELEVSGLLNDDLSGSQSLCGVRLFFKHERVENIRITLNSPSGQEITLLGPGRINSMTSSFINWNILFNDCATANDPDDGLAGQWDNSSNWQIFSDYTGTYDPFMGCLEDFDMGSANGTWTLTVDNLGDFEGQVLYFELIFCDPTGISCEECVVDPGNYVFQNIGGYISSCQGLSIDLSLMEPGISPVVYPGQDLSYVYSQGDEIIKYENSPNQIEDLEPGLYTICSLVSNSDQLDQVLLIDDVQMLQEAISDNQFCAAISEFCLTLEIFEIENEVLIDTSFCEGDSLLFRGITFYDDVDTSFTVSNIIDNSCDTLIRLVASVERIDPVIYAVDTVVVCGESIFLDGTQSSSNLSGITDFRWSTQDGELLNDVGPFVELSSAGTYTLAVNTMNCIDSTEITIASVDTLSFDLAIENKLCVEDSFVLNLSNISSQTNISFEGPGSPLQNNPDSYYVFEEGAYEIFLELGSCNDSLEFILVDQTAEYQLELISSVIDCDNPNAMIDIITDAIDPQFNISGPENLNTDQTQFELSISGMYSLELIDQQGCSQVIDFEVLNDMDLPEYTVSDLQIKCQELVPFFDLEISSPIDSIVWNSPDGNIIQSEQLIPEEEGEYSFEIFGSNGCSVSDVVEFIVDNIEFPLEFSEVFLDCENPSVELCVSSQTAFDSLIWISPSGQVTNEECFDASEVGEYELIAYSGLCVSDSFLVLEDNSIDIDFQLLISSGSLDCGTDSIFVELDFEQILTNSVIAWSDGANEISDEVSLWITEPGNFIVEVTDTLSKCTESRSFEIIEEENSLSNIELFIQQPVCFPENGILNISGLPGNTVFGIFLNEDVVDFRDLPNLELEPGDYVFEIEDENSCRFIQSFRIEEGRMLELDLGDDISTLPGLEIQISGNSNIPLGEIEIFNWTVLDSLSCLNCLTPSYFPAFDEQISLEIVDIFGCKALDTIQIFIKEDQIYFIPDIFSPNGDGNNDEFSIYLSDAITKVFDFRIFDRWGNLLLFRPEITGDSSNFVWDGYISDKKAELGVYVYMAKLLLVDGSERQIYGEISLIR